jgi:hypothetical protein
MAKAALHNRYSTPRRQVRTVRILIRPGKYILKQAVDLSLDNAFSVSVETMDVPENVFRPVRPLLQQEQPLQEQPAAQRRTPPKRRTSFTSLLRCSRPDAVEDTEIEETDWDRDWLMEGGPASPPPGQATLILRSRRHNEPVFRIRQGVLCLKNVEIQHNSHGLDIWNGNAAVQIQPDMDDDDLPVITNPRPTAVLERCQVTSRSGRGIVCIDGGLIRVSHTCVRDCAATGIYIGGPGSAAHVLKTDVIRNGVGNRSRRGIARGHSGVYLEQGVARITDCNVSHNTLAGVSVVSPDNASITLEETDLCANGTYQLELPPPGTPSRRRSTTNNNRMETAGQGGRFRSGLLLSENPSPPGPVLHPHFLG